MALSRPTTSNTVTRSRRIILAVAQGSARLRAVQKRHPDFLSERIVEVRHPAYRPAIVRPTSDAGEWGIGSIDHRRDGSRVLVRDRTMEHLPRTIGSASPEVSRASDPRLANKRTREVVVYGVQALSEKRPPRDRRAQLPGMFTLQREAECVQRRRCVSSGNPYMLLRERSGLAQASRALYIGIPSVAVAAAIWMLTHPSPLF